MGDLMKKSLIIIILSILFLSLVMPTLALAHSGRTDSSGGHNCSAKSKAKGLCSGYHYHNGGSSSSGSSSSSASTKVTKVKVISNEYPSSPHCKKVLDKYKSSDTYYNYYERIWDCNYYTEYGSIYSYLDLNLYLNNKYQSLNRQLINVKNLNYISVRDFANVFGFIINIDKAGDITLTKDKTVIKIFNENNKIFFNSKKTDVKAVKAEGSYYIPLRASMSWVKGNIDSVDKSIIYLSLK